jgi:hypothetical protein
MENGPTTPRRIQMRLPLDTSQMTFQSVGSPEPAVDFATKQPKIDENGAHLFNVQVVAISNGEAEIIQVRVSGEPAKFGPSAPLRITGLVASPWTMGDRSGISYRAEKIEPVGQAKAS